VELEWHQLDEAVPALELSAAMILFDNGNGAALTDRTL
jgi:nicotinate-nucleotide pyrophosphorylase